MMKVYLYAILALLTLARSAKANWQEWWTYDGISGPSYWGVINPAWTMCNRGRQQSPINVDPDLLVYDEGLDDHLFQVDKQPMSGNLLNSGQSLVFTVDSDRAAKMPVNITGGPLSYRYQFEQMFIHWGQENGPGGSEHSVNGHFFPAEVQLYGFNADLFHNSSEAIMQPHGLVGVSIMVQLTDREANRGLKPITNNLRRVMYKGQSHPIHNFNLQEMMPSTSSFVTYEGSVTYPGCWETVTWVVMNRPIYLTKQEMYELRQLMQGDKQNPKAPLSGNVRPVQQTNRRVVRTNIAFPAVKKKAPQNSLNLEYGYNYGGIYQTTDNSNTGHHDDPDCPDAFKDTSYQANSYLENSLALNS